MLYLSYLMFKSLKFWLYRLHNINTSLLRDILICWFRPVLFLSGTKVVKLKIVLLFIIFLGVGAVGWTNPSYAGLPAGNAITDGKALLRYALPINNQAIRNLQIHLEDISNQIRANRRWNAISKDISKALNILDKPNEIIRDIPQIYNIQAEDLIKELKDGVVNLQKFIPTKNKDKILQERSQLLYLVGKLEELMIQDFPFEVPEKYSNLPQLKGRATIEIETIKGDITMVVDGYSAPITAGNFVDLVQRGFYDGLEFTRAEESYVVQTGDPPGEEFGFVDTKTKQYRFIPLEILVDGDNKPLYGNTFEQAGLYTKLPQLPFSAYGTVAMAHAEVDVNNASSQFFFLLFDSELTPAGRNILDGQYSVFGYVTQGKEVLGKIRAGDKIMAAKVISGGEKLIQPKAA
ncbi:Peptidyl-prolyl cis-trans isomerase [Richelia intracellularis HH01]|uniref:peptidylprolyl isomerase n=1 Tax=Richelia intracellularis HH01 TaxID=1165094 RepID=M1X4H4_9NOST|nr:Peptidyl-prolyl cis-trans isomerase [Richelia intracellularis HH01]